jgi:hypothetical protein
MLKKLLILLILFSVTLAFFSAIGLLLIPGTGELYGFGFSIFVLIIIMFCADKFILGIVHAKKTHVPHRFKEVAANYACRFGVNKINVYSSQLYVNNIYFTNSTFGTPSLIIGRNLFSSISDEELEVLIVAALWRIKAGDAGFRTIASLILSLYSLPLLLIKNKSGKLASVINYFIFPLNLIKFIIFKTKSSEILSDHKIFKLGSSKEAFSSAIYKVSLMENKQIGAFSSSIVQYLAIADNKSNEMMNTLSFLGMRVEAKYSNLMS